MSRKRDAAITAKLSTWFSHAARDLPWRNRRTGYSALVSEAMLQQTQVSRVIEKYQAFMKRFPTVRKLAEAEEQDVLAIWQGLGYYRRARHLHAAARAVMREHKGRVPRSAAALRTLPGVGTYTAGAIASIAFDQREAIVDGNVHRVLARLDADASLTRDSAWPRAAALVREAHSPGVFNEALMELGATICTPRTPRCDQCPLQAHCRARRSNRQQELPAVKSAAARQVMHHHAVVISRNGSLLVQQRGATGLWAGLWQVPTIESQTELDEPAVVSQLQVPVTSTMHCGSFTHHLTHRAVTFHVYAATSRARRGRWVSRSEIEQVPMSSAQRRVLAVAQRSCEDQPAVAGRGGAGA